MEMDYQSLDWDLIGKFNRENYPETTFSRAQQHLKHGNFTEAILDLDFYLQSHPESHIAFNLLGIAYSSVDNFSKAIKAFEKAMLIKSENIPFRFLYEHARSLQVSKRLDESLKICNTLVAEHPNDALGFLLKSQVLIELDEFEKSFYNISKCIELDSKIWQAWTTKCLIDYNLNDFSRVEEDFQKAYSLNINLPANNYKIYASALSNLERYDEAKSFFEIAMKLGDDEAKQIFEKLSQ